MSLSGVNSINWARIMAQIVYYFSSAISLGSPDRPVSFTVPTGNFGDIFAGYAAKRMGLPIDRLVIATNDNDILARTLATGEYRTRGVVATTSPSMDIQVSSNFERLLFEAAGRDAGAVRRYMDGLKQSGAFTIEAAALAAHPRRIRRRPRRRWPRPPRRSARRCSAAATCSTRTPRRPSMSPMTRPATDSADGRACHRASGKISGCRRGTPAASSPRCPTGSAGLMDAEERFTVLPSDLKMVEDYISRHARAAR